MGLTAPAGLGGINEFFSRTEEASMVTKMAALVVMCLVLFNGIPAPAHAQGKAVLFEDNFSTLDPIWSNPTNNLSVKENNLLLTTEKDMCRFTLYKGNTFGEMDLQVTVQLAQKMEGPSNGVGIIFWADDFQNYYCFSMTPDGLAGVRRKVKGNTLTPVPVASTDAVNKDPQAANILRVVLKGKQATCYINNKEVAVLKGRPPEDGGMIGFLGCADTEAAKGTTWKISNLKVTTP
jgi:hypothetical protein